MTASADAGLAATSMPFGASPPLKAIARLAAPLAGFFAVQSITNLACTAMIGRLGNAALAGVGVASAVYGVALALMFGIDTAVQATISRAAGAGREEAAGRILAEAWLLSVPLGVLLAAASWLSAPAIFAALLHDPVAAEIGARWLRAAAPSFLGFSLTIPVNACWIGAGRPRRAFLVNAVTAPLQIAATWVLLFGFGSASDTRAAGAGAAMSLAALSGVGLQAWLAARHGLIGGRAWRAPNLRGSLAIAGIGWPISLQQAFLQLGLMLAFAIVAQLGVRPAAATNVLVTLTLVPTQLTVALGVAAATLVGQSLGAGSAAEARRWGWRAAGLGALLCAGFGLFALAFPQLLLAAFLKDPATLAMTVWPLRVIGLGLAASAVAQVLDFALRGAGATRIGAAIPFAGQWLAQLPLSWWLAIKLGLGLLGLAAVQSGTQLAEATVTALIWAGSSWARRRS